MLAEPGPVGGVVAGCTTGAERDVVEDVLVSGAGGVRGTSEGGIVAFAAGPGFEGVTMGAGLGTVVSSSFFSLA
jgi:hypothetical protein